MEGGQLEGALEKLAEQNARVAQQAGQLEQSGAGMLNQRAFEEEEEQE